MHLSVQNWKVVDYETTILNATPYISSTSDKIFDITLECDLDLTMFGLIFEVFPQYRHMTVHNVTALITHI